jgi:hypothetical protein
VGPLQERYARCAGEPTDGGEDFTLQDHLGQACLARRLGVSPGEFAQRLGVPLEYAEALFAAAEWEPDE